MLSFCNGSLWHAFNQFNKFAVKLFLIWVIAQFGAVNSALAETVVADSLVKNASFEDGSINWGRNWGSSNFVGNGQQRSGLKALRVGPSKGGRAQNVVSRVEAGKSYRFTGYARLSASGVVASLGVKFKNSNDVEISSKLLRVSGTSYSKYTVDVTVPSGASYVYIMGFQTSGSGYAFFDDFELKPLILPVADSLVKNASFENGTTNWERNWGSSNFVGNNQQRSGSKALRVGPSKGGRAQNVVNRVEAGKSYRFTGYARRSDSGVVASLGVKFKNSKDVEISSKLMKVSGTSYSKYTVDVTVPSGATYVYVMGFQSSGSGYAFFDDFELKSISSTSPTPDPGTSLPAPIADSLVKNASFESGATNWNHPWKDSAIVTSGQRSGSRVLQVGPGDGGLGQDVSSQVKVGSEYRLTAYGRVSKSGIAAYLRATFKNNSGAVISRKFVEITSTSYSKYSVDFKVPSGSTQVYVQGVRGIDGSTGYVFLDDFELKLLNSSTPDPGSPSPIADSLVKNASFESGTTNWNHPWKDSAIVTSGQRSGSRALQVGPGDGGLGQDVFSQVKVGNEYRLTAYGRVSKSGIAAYLRATFKNKSGGVISRKFVEITSTSYSKYSVDFKVPSGSTQVYVQGVRGRDGSTGYVFLDDFELKLTSSTSPTPDPDPTPDPGTSTSAAANAYCQMHAGMDHSGGHSTPHPDDPEKQEEHMAAMGLLSPSQATHMAVKCGLWSATSTWKNGRIPKTGADVYIPVGLGVTYDMNSQEELHYVRVDGFMDFATQKNTLMKVNTVIASPTSVFHIGTKAAPIRSNVKAKIVVLDDGAINMSHDPLQISRGLVLHGTTEIHGMKKKSFLALKVNPRAGDRSLTVSGNTTNWKVGDEVVVVGTHPFQGIKRLGVSASEDEVRTITGISGDTIQLDSALTYNHDVISGHGFLNYVGNASRNVSIRSENPNGTRGHFMIMHSPKAQVRYAEFRDLGRSDRRIAVSDTNPIGRYSLHLHRTGATATSERAIAEGNAVINGPGWGIVHHDSFAAVNHNFVFNFVGAGIVSESGSEVGEWVGNLVTTVTGNGYTHSESNFTNMRKFGPGFNGIAYFGASRAVIQQHNIAANTKIGWDFEARLGDASGRRAGTQFVDSLAFKFNAVPFVSHKGDSDMHQFIGFVGNRAYALGNVMRSTHREHGSQTNAINEMRDLKAWRVRGTAFNFKNYTWDYTFRDFVIIGNGNASAFLFWNKTEGMSFVNVHIENFEVGIDYGLFNYAGVLKNVKFVNLDKNITTETQQIQALYQEYLNGKRASDPRPIHPQTGKRYIPQAIPLKFVSSVNQVAKPVLTMDPSNVYEVRPGAVFTLKGKVRDSFGEYAFGNSMWWFSPQVHSEPMYRMKDYKVNLNYTGKRETAPLDVILPRNGVIKKADGWYMPVTFWLADRFTAINHPYTFYFKVNGMSDSFLQQHELKNYTEPTRSLNLYNSQSDY